MVLSVRHTETSMHEKDRVDTGHRSETDDLAYEHRPSRRDLLRTGGAIVVAPGAMGLFAGDAGAQSQTRDADTLDRLLRAARDPRRRILLKGGTIISMDSGVGDFARGDLLIEGKRIAAVNADLAAAQDGNTIVVDATDAIVIPGFVDCHRHAWEGQIRGVIPNSATIGDYMGATHRGFAPHYRPEDMYIGNLITALGCIDAGITCLIDNSHNSRSSAHSDAAVKALFDSGNRGVHAAGPPQAGDWDHQLPQDLARLQKQFFSSTDQLVTLRVFAGPVKEQWAYARSLGLRITMEFQGAAMGKIMDQFAEEKLLGPDLTFNHCGNLPETTWQNLKNAGATI